MLPKSHPSQWLRTCYSLSVLRGVKQGNVSMSVWIWAKKAESASDHDEAPRYDTGPRLAPQKPVHCPVQVSCLHPGSVSRWQPHSSPESGSFASSWSSSPEISITSSHPSHGERTGRIPTELLHQWWYFTLKHFQLFTEKEKKFSFLVKRSVFAKCCKVSPRVECRPPGIIYVQHYVRHYVHDTRRPLLWLCTSQDTRVFPPNWIKKGKRGI